MVPTLAREGGRSAPGNGCLSAVALQQSVEGTESTLGLVCQATARPPGLSPSFLRHMGQGQSGRVESPMNSMRFFHREAQVLPLKTCGDKGPCPFSGPEDRRWVRTRWSGSV